MEENNNLFKEYEEESKEAVKNRLGITIEEFLSLPFEEQRKIFMVRYFMHKENGNNDLIKELKKESNEAIKRELGVTKEEFLNLTYEEKREIFIDTFFHHKENKTNNTKANKILTLRKKK